MNPAPPVMRIFFAMARIFVHSASPAKGAAETSRGRSDDPLRPRPTAPSVGDYGVIE